MNLRYLEIFCDVVAMRSFSKAAAAHDVAQSSASQAVLQLEDRLGTRLIDRSKRPLELTPAGEVYVKGCRELLAGFRSVEDEVRSLENKVTGAVRVAAIYSVGLHRLDQIVRQYRRSYPDAGLTIDYRPPDEVRRQVVSGEADLGIISYARETTDLEVIPWTDQEVGLVVTPDHPLAGRHSVRPHELGGLELIGFNTGLGIRRETDRWLKDHDVEVTVVHEFDTIENVKRDVEIGSGAALLPLATVATEVANRSLVAVAIDGEPLVRPLGIIHDKHHTLSVAAQRFLGILRELDDEPPRAFDRVSIANAIRADAAARARSIDGAPEPATSND